MLPVYNAIIKDENDGVFAVSLVDCPATEVNWVAFSKEEKIQFSLDETKHCLTAPLMVADTLIYRCKNGYEYYIKYEADTLRLMAEKMLADNTFNEIDFQHDGNIIEKGKVNLLELYIKDESKPSPFDVPDGSIICTYKINDEAIWKAATDGTFNGFSLAGYFNVEEVQKNNNIQKMSLKDKLKNLFLEYAKTVTDKATLVYEGELAVGVEVTDENGEVIADGEYATEDKIIVVKDGKVDEIKDVEPTEPTEPTEPEENEEPTEPAEPAEPAKNYDEDINALKEAVTALEATVATLTEKLTAIEEKLSQPAANSPEDEYNENPKEDKFSRIGKYLKN